MKTLDIILPLNNARRYKRRYQLYKEFIKRLLPLDNIRITTVELAFGERNNLSIDESNPKHKIIKLRNSSELWHKENLLNIAVLNLENDWKYVAWIDTDISFTNEDWVIETLNMLQHHPIVQMFQTAVNLGSDGRVLEVYEGFAYQYSKENMIFGQDKKKTIPKKYKYDPYLYRHPGYCYACTREFYNKMGGFDLLQYCILGAGDYHLACALIGKVEDSIPNGISNEYKQMMKQIQTNIQEYIGQLGYVDGTIVHYFHGSRSNRRYADRWQILIQNNYIPLQDVRLDEHGILTLNNNKPKLKRDLQTYFILRSEDDPSED